MEPSERAFSMTNFAITHPMFQYEDHICSNEISRNEREKTFNTFPH